MAKKKDDKGIFEQPVSQIANLMTSETTATMQLNNINQQDFFEQIYKDLQFCSYDLFCVLTPDRIASSAEFGFIAPSDNLNWNEPIEFFPEYDLSEVEKIQTKACVYVKVPLKWAKLCEVLKDNRLVFKSNLNSLFLFAEVKEYYVSPNFQKEVESKLFIYEYSVSFGIKGNWKQKNTDKIQLLAIQDPILIDKMLGGIIVSSIEEVFGKLIDSGRIPVGSKYIQPFTSYEITEKSDKVFYDTVLLGSQGFGLIYSLIHFLESGNLENISQTENRYFSAVQKQGFIPLKETKASLHTSLIWYVPLIFRHFESLKEGNAKLFRAELQTVMKSNNIETSIENQWAVVMFAGFSAKAIAGDMWDNGVEGIKKSFDIIKKLKESVADELFPNGTDDLTSENAHISLKFLKKIADTVKSFAENSKFSKIVELPYTFAEEVTKGDYLHSVVASLCILWATDTMSKDWYNVFNRAFNANHKGLSNLFPILGMWMGFLHGYKKIRRRKNYKFSNDEFLEILAVNTAKKALHNDSFSMNFSFDQSNIIKSFVYNSGSKELKIVQFDTNFSLPVIQEVKNKEVESLKNRLKDFDELLKELDKKQEVENKIQNIVRRNK